MDKKVFPKFMQMLSISQISQLRDEILLPAKKTNRIQWIVSRELCLYRLIDFRHIPEDSRSQALDFEFQNHSPFELTDYYVIWKEGIAQVWFWDKKLTATVLDEQSVEAFEIVPESILMAPETDDGLKFIKTLDDGVDLQLWNEGVLLASQWYKKIPINIKIEQFISGVVQLPNRQTVIHSSEEMANIPLLTKPLTTEHWTAAKKTFVSLKGFNIETLLVILVFSILSGFIYWQLIGIYRTHSQLNGIEQSIEQSLQQAGENVTSKTTTLVTQNKNERLLKIIDYPSQAQLLLLFGQVIADQGDTLKEWKYNLNKLEIVIENNKSTALTYINRLQTMPMVGQVTSEPGRITGQIKLNINLNLSEGDYNE